MPSSMSSGIAAILLSLGLSVSCGQPTGVPDNDSASSNAQAVPFDASQSGNSSSLPPLLASDRLPEGTPITIRLVTPVSSSTSHAGDTFEGTLDDSIVIKGETVVPRGAAVTGRVLAAKAASRLNNPGYLRVAVVGLTVEGRRFPISTSSLFVKGGTHEKRVRSPGSGTTAFFSEKNEVSFATERRLTFRLAQAIESY